VAAYLKELPIGWPFLGKWISTPPKEIALCEPTLRKNCEPKTTCPLLYIASLSQASIKVVQRSIEQHILTSPGGEQKKFWKKVP